MAEIGLFFGSDEGNTEAVAEKIQQVFGEEVLCIHDIGESTQLDFVDYDLLILGIPTWDFGQIQSDWEEFWGDLGDIDFSNKTIALFGLGDQFGYGDFFLDAMGMLHDVLIEAGAKTLGFWPVEGYEFDASKALTQDKKCFVGLALDEDQQPEQTNARVNLWCEQVNAEFDLHGELTLLTIE